MSRNTAEIIQLKKTKKDGLIDDAVHQSILSYLTKDKFAIVPVDFVYGISARDTNENYVQLLQLIESDKALIWRLIHNFKMMEELVSVGKHEFDFLHRIWPGEMVVYLEVKDTGLQHLPLRIPKSRLCQEIINNLDKPLLFAPLLKMEDRPLYQKSTIIDYYKNIVDCIVIIDEFCKEHTLPTILDLRNNELKIMNEGRISAEEIKSLYFLGKDDSAD